MAPNWVSCYDLEIFSTVHTISTDLWDPGAAIHKKYIPGSFLELYKV